jgi:CRISPR-associated protein Cas2
MYLSGLSHYRYMWVFVCYDLPTDTKKQRKAAALFRKDMLKAGFQMFQFSIYIRPCPSREAAAMHVDRVKNFLPKEGKIGIFTLTDKQFGMMELFYGFEKVNTPLQPQQLELF